MLWEYLDFWYCIPLLMLILVFCAGHAYRVNARRALDDPDKRDFHFGAIWLALLGPVLLPLYLGFLLIQAVAFATSLVVVIVGLVILRKPFLVAWLQKVCAHVGNQLLELNTALIHAFLGKAPKKPPS